MYRWPGLAPRPVTAARQPGVGAGGVCWRGWRPRMLRIHFRHRAVAAGPPRDDCGGVLPGSGGRSALACRLSEVLWAERGASHRFRGDVREQPSE